MIYDISMAAAPGSQPTVDEGIAGPTSGPATMAPAPVSSRISKLTRVASADRITFVLVLVGACVVWHLVVVLMDVAPYVLPTPLEVLETAIDEWDGLLHHTLATGQEMVVGFGLAAVSGVLLAGVMTYFKAFDKILSPLLVAFQTIPKVALAPLFVVWFGFGMLPRVLVALAIAFFPIVIDTMVGLRATPHSTLESVRVMGASRWQIFWKVQLPSALPNMFGGLKVAATLVVIGAVVGEYIVANEGLGYLQLQASAKFDSPLLFASVIMMALLGLFLYELVGWVERLSMPWTRARDAG